MVNLQDRFLNKVKKTKTCWLWTGCISSNGYGHIRINNQAKLVHRISYELFKGIIPTGLNVCHTCDIRNCVKPQHLWLGTQGDNLRDCYFKGRKIGWNIRGEEQHLSKLREEDVLKIRELYKNTSSRQLAKQFGVVKTSILNIVHNRTWKHV